MIVELGAGDATIAEADDCRRLHVTAPPDLDVSVALENSGLGRLSDTGEALLIISELHRRAAAASTGVNWQADWEAMIDYATAKGWVTPDRREVTAHFEGL